MLSIIVVSSTHVAPVWCCPNTTDAMAQQPTQDACAGPAQDGTLSQIQCGLQHQVNVAQLQDGRLPHIAAVNIEPDIEDTQYGVSTA